MLSSQWTQAIKNTNVSKVIVVEEDDDDGAEKEDDYCKDNTDNKEIINYKESIKDAKSKGKHCDTEVMDSEDPLFILYTSGTTGEPKGTIQVHGGFTVVAAQQTAFLIDMKPTDTLFWYADIGWITDQTWVVYGSPMIGGTALIYEGALDYPHPDTWCKLIEKQLLFSAPPLQLSGFL